MICSDGSETKRGQSGQEDIVIYDPSLLPPIIKKAEQSIVPLEAVLAIIEVKSVLGASDYRQAVEHSSEIRAMPSGLKLNVAGKEILNQFRYPQYHMYGLSSDITGENKTEWERLIEAHEKCNVSYPVLNSICCSDTQRYTQHHGHPDEFKKYDDTSHAARVIMKAMECILESEELIQKLRIRNTKYWLLGILDLMKVSHATRVRMMAPVVLSSYFQESSEKFK